MKLIQKNEKVQLCDLENVIQTFDKNIVHWAIVKVENETVTLSVTVVV